MALISEIKCAKCDRVYSGIRSRCPYCSTRRIARGKYSDSGDNSRGKMLVAVIVMFALVVATGVLLFTTEVPDDEYVPDDGQLQSPPASNGPSPGLPDIDDGTLTLPGTPVDPPVNTGDPITTPDPTPTGVQSVSVRYGRNALQVGADGPEFTLRMSEGSIQLNVLVQPEGIDETPEWVSSDDSIFSVTPTSPEATEAIVRAIRNGNARLTVTVGEVSQVVIVRVR